MKRNPSTSWKRRRTLDYLVFALSLAGLLTIYEMVVGCGGSLPASAKFQVLDDNEKDSVGRLELTPQDECTTVQVSNDVTLNGIAECQQCGSIAWTANPEPAAQVTLGSAGDFTTALICRTGVTPEGGRASVTLVGRYRRQISQAVTQEQTIVRRIPLRIP